MRVLDDRPADGLRRRLVEFEGRMRTLRRTIEASGASRESLGRSIAIAEASLNRVKGDAMAAQARMHAQAEAEVLAASDNVGRWKGGGETEKLRSRAEGAEAYAAWSLIVATRAICDVELATLKAISARTDLEDGSTE
jgi:hypothetical protein